MGKNEMSLGDMRHSADVLVIELYNILNGLQLPDDLRQKVQELAEYADEKYHGAYNRVYEYNKYGEPHAVYIAIDD